MVDQSDRQRWLETAEAAIERQRQMNPGNDNETDLADCLGNLLHWADAHGVDFDEALRRGRFYHTEETQELADDAPETAPAAPPEKAVDRAVDCD